MTDASSDHPSWKRLGELARSVANAPVSASQNATGRMRLMVAAAGARRIEPRVSLRPLLAAGLSAAIVGVAALVYQWQGRPLTYEVFGGQRFASNYVGAHASAPAKVMFSDGSEIDARPGSRLRIDETRSNGARVLIERGTAAARVKHRDRSRWVFSAGPFDVRVIGTKFDLDWDPVGQVVSLTLHEGAVEVASPVGQSHCIVRAGQRFRASLGDGSMTLENIADTQRVAVGRNADRAVASRSELQASAAVELTPTTKHHTVREEPRRKPVAKPSSWSKLVRRGEFQSVVDAALAGDIAATLATCSAAEARALADAARYTDQSELAERALSAIRSRFPDSRHSGAAGFLLGRVNETRGRTAEADRWYQGYLDEAPSGEYAADALAGRMRAVFARSGAEAARPIAREYLERFPQGVHLRMARRLAGQP